MPASPRDFVSGHLRRAQCLLPGRLRSGTSSSYSGSAPGDARLASFQTLHTLSVLSKSSAAAETELYRRLNITGFSAVMTDHERSSYKSLNALSGCLIRRPPRRNRLFTLPSDDFSPDPVPAHPERDDPRAPEDYYDAKPQVKTSTVTFLVNMLVSFGSRVFPHPPNSLRLTPLQMTDYDTRRTTQKVRHPPGVEGA
jgi:hypothetical protein